MENRIKKFDTAEIGQKISQYSRASLPVSFQADPENDINNVISEYIEWRVTEAKKQAFVEGKKEAVRELEGLFHKEYEQYKDTIGRIVKIVSKITEDTFRSGDFKIIESRTSLSYEMQVKILFVIDTKVEDELPFVQLLNQLKKNFLAQDKLFAEIYFINQRSSRLDHSSINMDYPWGVTLNNKPTTQ